VAIGVFFKTATALLVVEMEHSRF